MNKFKLTVALMSKQQLTERAAREVVDIIFESCTKQLKHNDRIELKGIGSFAVKKSRAYEGKNPKTREAIEVKPKKLPLFKVRKELKNWLINNF